MSPLIALALAATSSSSIEERWDVSYRAGYAYEPTTGVSSQGFGMGPLVSYVLPSAVRFEGAFLWSNGGEARAHNDRLEYHAEYSSSRATLGVAYEVGRRNVRGRFGVRGGALLVGGFTRVGGAVAKDESLFGLLGPSAAFVVRHGRFEAGIDGEAYFLPSWVGAPILAAYGFFGVRL